MKKFSHQKNILIILTTILAITFSACTPQPVTQNKIPVSAGWNLGNQLDCFAQGTVDGKITTIYKDGIPVSANSLPAEEIVAAYETLWGMPVIRPELIQSVKAQGFDSIRLPVTWSPHLDAENKIDQAWMNRVEQVVDMILDEGLECILNIHHDTNHLKYIVADNSNIDLYKTRLANLWTQIANQFKNKSQKLMFEGFNEILNASSNWDPIWDNSDGSYSAVNALNQIFVDTVRSTGANNSNRMLICNAYATNITNGNIANFSLPSDTVKEKLTVQYHNYNHDYQSIQQKFQMLKSTYTENGIKVIIGECGIMGTEQTDEVTRYVYAQWIADLAYDCGLKLFWWDDGNTNYTWDTIGTHAIFSRRVTGTQDNPDYSRYGHCYFPQLCKILTER